MTLRRRLWRRFQARCLLTESALRPLVPVLAFSITGTLCGAVSPVTLNRLASFAEDTRERRATAVHSPGGRGTAATEAMAFDPPGSDEREFHAEKSYSSVSGSDSTQSSTRAVKGGHVAVMVAAGICVICGLFMCATYIYQKWRRRDGNRTSETKPETAESGRIHREAASSLREDDQTEKGGTHASTAPRTQGSLQSENLIESRHSKDLDPSSFIADTHLGDPLSKAVTLLATDTACWTATSSMMLTRILREDSSLSEEEEALPPSIPVASTLDEE
ncbi:hypothetical protein BESB_065530 [Besnoitia besnoiti]|uniref:Transmembrane protein n=1 Tax=Besnoitia besnoiti TaxID=94643 RepID=A0A2A9ME23_BESBE|nr:hypothetical protein BESB_065530 [Besnoitia besnoiti]PFH34521.1 hypothetical protein BESB_065530 [Besnoitia besnoiti]